MSETTTEAVQKEKKPSSKGSGSTAVIIVVAIVAILGLIFYFVDPFGMFHSVPPIDAEDLKGSWQFSMTIDTEETQQSNGDATKPSENSQSLTMKLDFPNQSATFEWGSDLIVTPFERTEGKNDFHLDYSAYEGALHLKFDGNIKAIGNTYTMDDGRFVVEYKGDNVSETFTGHFVAILNK